MARDDDWDAIREHGKEQHAERVGKNADRVAYAEEQFKKNNIEYVLKNPAIGHFHCRTQKTDKLVQFWAGTGMILLPDRNARGIHTLIEYLLTH